MESVESAEIPRAQSHKRKEIKCVVWDLDDTLWDGVLLENDELELRAGVREALELLDARGILHSIASRNDPSLAIAKLRAFGLDQYFLYPQIGWSSKSESLRNVSKLINVGMDSLAFVDDQPFERDEVRFSCPDVMCLDAEMIAEIPRLPEMNPRFITEDSRRRRAMYLADATRQLQEEAYQGPKEEFLATLGMVFAIRPAREEDLKRAEELTVRTNQLNTTGYTYSYEELEALSRSPDHLVLIAGLDDKYGTYGKIGLALVEKFPGRWNIRLLLMSCRVMSRGVGSVLINYIRTIAREAGVALEAEMMTTDRNRMMYMTYKFLGFDELSVQGSHAVFGAGLGPVPPPPSYVKLVTE